MWFRNLFGADKRAAQKRGKSSGRRTNQNSGEEASSAARLTPQALNQLNRLFLNTGAMHLGQPSGSRSSVVRKPAADFRDHRQYVPGDDVRFVDWKASARQEHVFVKQGEQEKAALVYVLIDTSASMAWGDPPKANAALTLAHALGYLSLAHNDRLFVMPVSARDDSGSALHPLGPLWGKGQAPQLSGYLQAIRFRGQIDLPNALAGLNKRNLSSGGLVLVISDLFGIPDLSPILDALPEPSWRLTFCHVLHPAELNPELNGHFNMVDIETGQKKLYTITPKALETYHERLEAWKTGLAETCRERRAGYSLLSSGWALENEIISQLRRDRVVKPL